MFSARSPALTVWLLAGSMAGLHGLTVVMYCTVDPQLITAQKKLLPNVSVHFRNYYKLFQIPYHAIRLCQLSVTLKK